MKSDRADFGIRLHDGGMAHGPMARRTARRVGGLSPRSTCSRWRDQCALAGGSRAVRPIRSASPRGVLAAVQGGGWSSSPRRSSIDEAAAAVAAVVFHHR
jgi:hypothetical protein